MRAPGSSPPGLLDRILDDHADALFDFALAVTAGPEFAVEAVRDAVPAALEAHGPAVSRAVLLGSVLEAALRRAEPPGTLVGAVLLTRLAQQDCRGLAAVLETHEADAGKLAAAVVEHQEACAACGDRRRALVPVASLLAAVPPTPAPPELRRATGFRRVAPSVHPRRSPWLGRLPLRAAAAATVACLCLLGAGLALVLRDGREERPAPTPAGGRLALGTDELDLGPTGIDGTFEVANTGRERLEFRVRPGAPWLRVVGAKGVLDPGGRMFLVAVLDRSRAPEGEITSELRVRTSGGSAVLPVRAVVERAPVLSGFEATPEQVVHVGCPGATPSQVRATVVEESGVRRVELRWRGPEGVEQAAEMVTGGESTFTGALGPFPTPGDVSWSVSVTDIRGNTTVSTPEVLRVQPC